MVSDISGKALTVPLPSGPSASGKTKPSGIASAAPDGDSVKLGSAAKKQTFAPDPKPESKSPNPTGTSRGDKGPLDIFAEADGDGNGTLKVSELLSYLRENKVGKDVIANTLAVFKQAGGSLKAGLSAEQADAYFNGTTGSGAAEAGSAAAIQPAGTPDASGAEASKNTKAAAGAGPESTPAPQTTGTTGLSGSDPDAFTRIDGDGDGVVTVGELADFLDSINASQAFRQNTYALYQQAGGTKSGLTQEQYNQFVAGPDSGGAEAGSTAAVQPAGTPDTTGAETGRHIKAAAGPSGPESTPAPQTANPGGIYGEDSNPFARLDSSQDGIVSIRELARYLNLIDADQTLRQNVYAFYQQAGGTKDGLTQEQFSAFLESIGNGGESNPSTGTASASDSGINPAQVSKAIAAFDKTDGLDGGPERTPKGVDSSA